MAQTATAAGLASMQATLLQLASHREFRPCSALGEIALCVCVQHVIVRCALDIARGIQHLHRSHIVHGDLKPQNVMLSSLSPVMRAQDLTPAPANFPYATKLTDFGLSFHIGHDKSHMSNMRVGTPFYYAPVCLLAPPLHDHVHAIPTALSGHAACAVALTPPAAM
jgi:hypothetical protein